MANLPDVVCRQVSGSRGSGKTSYVDAQLRVEGARRYIVLDPIGGNDYLPGITVDERVETRADLLDYLKDVGDGPFSVAFVPNDEGAELDYICARLCGGEWLRNLTLVVEEAHDSASSRACPPSLLKLAKRGRHWGIGLWVVSQRPSDVSPHLRAELNAHESVYFRLSEHIDLEVLARRRDWDFADAVASLRKCEFLRLTNGHSPAHPWGAERGCVKFDTFGRPHIFLQK